jgi:hypothetical protein
MMVIACSQNDFKKIMSKKKQNLDFIIMKANPVCETVG